MIIYYLTITCELIFNYSQIDNKLIDGIIYPSVKYSYQDYNIVIHPRAMSKLDFSNATFAWVIYDATYNTAQFAELETAFANDKENIKWDLWKH